MEQVTINWLFKSALVDAFGSQIDAARQLKINHSLISLMVRGRRMPHDHERQKLERALGKKITQRCFPEIYQ